MDVIIKVRSVKYNYVPGQVEVGVTLDCLVDGEYVASFFEEVRIHPAEYLQKRVVLAAYQQLVPHLQAISRELEEELATEE